jgi:hypothetical protein
MPFALRTIMIPGTLTAGYQRGHEIPQAVVDTWDHLIEGEDYADEVPDAQGPAAVARPKDDTDRGAWVQYVVSRGTDPTDASQMQLDELMALYSEQQQDASPVDDSQRGTGITRNIERPAASAKKTEWVDYVLSNGADESWARSDDTTKADLQEWDPAGSESRRAPQATTDPAADQGNASVGQ